jgi:hypothetical protein
MGLTRLHAGVNLNHSQVLLPELKPTEAGAPALEKQKKGAQRQFCAPCNL